MKRASMTDNAKKTARDLCKWLSLSAAFSMSVACGADPNVSAEGEYSEVSSALTTYQVGPGKAYASLQAVAGKLLPGDVVEVYGGATYAGGVRFTRPGTPSAKITIRGVSVNGQRPKISGGTSTVDFSANHYVFENFDVSGGTSRCVFHHAHDITIRGSVVHDCAAHGILGADTDSGSLLLDRSEVYRSGSGTNLHQIYIATDETAYPKSVFRMQHCYVHDGLGGNNVKSRAERNEIYYNWIEGAYYHELELIGPDGQAEGLAREDSDVAGNVLFQGYQSRSHHPIRIGGDGTGQTWGRYRFLNNTIVLGSATTSAVFRTFDGIESVEMHNNVLFRIGGGPVNVLRDTEARWKSGRVITGSKNWVTASSSAVPSSWSSTQSGSNPGFVDVISRNVRLAAGSVLQNVGNSIPVSAAGFAFPNPLTPTSMEPPAHALSASPASRTVVSSIDIGAYELAGTGTSYTPPAPLPPTSPSIVTPPPSSGGSATLFAVADAYVESGAQGNANYGSLAQLFSATTADGSATRDTYLKFDLSSVAKVSSAKLRVRAALTSSSNGSIAMSVYPVATSTWSERDIVWNNKPGRVATALSTVTVSSLSYVVYELDVTSFVKAEKAAGRNLVSLGLHNPGSTSARVLLQSRETTGKPELVVAQ